jgi:hypothetical protein
MAKASSQQKSSEAAVPVIAAAGGPLKMSGLTLLSLAAGAASLIASIILVVALAGKMSDTAIFGSLLAALVLGIVAVVCGSLSLDASRETLLPRRDRMVMIGGSVLTALGLTVAIATQCILMASVVQPDPTSAEFKTPVLMADAKAAPARELPPAVTPTAPAATPTGGAVGTETPAAGTETPKAGTETPAAGTETPKAGTETPAAGTETPKAGTETPAAGTETPKAGTETPAAETETPAATPSA